LQMLLTFASTFAFSSLIAASPGAWGPGLVTPSIFPLPPARLFANPPELAAPTVPVAVLPDPDGIEPADVEPDELAVPAAFVPGADGTFAALPTPLGSFTELFSPPALAGPLGTPLMPAVPAPAEPAFGVPVGLTDPAVGPLAAPVAEAPVAPPADPPPADAPPPEPPPELPPPLCAYAAIGAMSAIIKVYLSGLNFRIGTPLEYRHGGNAEPVRLFQPGTNRIFGA
jgi:hypothetical protein